MNDVVIASTEADARAVEAVEEHHAALAGALGTHVERLLVAASGSETEATDRARDGLVAWCRTGPPGARVADVTTHEVPPEGGNDFRVTW